MWDISCVVLCSVSKHTRYFLCCLMCSMQTSAISPVLSYVQFADIWDISCIVWFSKCRHLDYLLCCIFSMQASEISPVLFCSVVYRQLKYLLWCFIIQWRDDWISPVLSYTVVYRQLRFPLFSYSVQTAEMSVVFRLQTTETLYCIVRYADNRDMSNVAI